MDSEIEKFRFNDDRCLSEHRVFDILAIWGFHSQGKCTAIRHHKRTKIDYIYTHVRSRPPRRNRSFPWDGTCYTEHISVGLF